MDGVLIIDKPKGPTSHDVVQTVKRLIGAAKVGHLGTLDPGATGVLPLVIDGATKMAAMLAGTDKIYEFTLVLGRTTETDDDEGNTISEQPVPKGAKARIEALIPTFTGKISQRPPAISAVKVGGERSYKVARRGGAVCLEARTVEVKKLSILSSSGSKFKMRLECKSGTYVRSICRDIGEALGCGGHAADIRRLKSGNYDIEKAVSLEELQADPSRAAKRLIAVVAG